MLTETVYSIHITHCPRRRNTKWFAFTNTKQEKVGNQCFGGRVEDEQLGGDCGRSYSVGGGEGGQLPDGGGGRDGRLQVQPDAGRGRPDGGGVGS